jgi:hypothetical protein
LALRAQPFDSVTTLQLAVPYRVILKIQQRILNPLHLLVGWQLRPLASPVGEQVGDWRLGTHGATSISSVPISTLHGLPNTCWCDVDNDIHVGLATSNSTIVGKRPSLAHNCVATQRNSSSRMRFGTCP